MRSTRSYLALIALAATAVVSCDTRLPTASRRSAPGTPPDVVIDTPLVNAQINLGDSIYVRVLATGGNALKTLTIGADAISGDQDLGTYAETPRFKPVVVEFPAGTTDTIIRRYIQPIDPKNETLDSLVVFAILEDSLGQRDTARVRAAIVSGPKVTIESPAANDSVTPGVALGFTARATDADGISQIQIIVRSEGTAWGPLAFTDTMTEVFGGTSRDVTTTKVKVIPVGAPSRGRITVIANALDGNRQPGSSPPIALFVRSAASIAAPHVQQVVPARSERNEIITITANGAGITAVGLLVRDSAGVEIDRFSVPVLPVTSNVKIGVALRLPVQRQGQRILVTAFAVDQSGRIGYAVPSSTSPVETDEARAQMSEARIVYGQTYDLPLPGIVGDVAVDVARGNVFLSNTVHNRLEVWQNASRSFDPNGVAVGSLPWGLFMAATAPLQDTLLVANSGGTNISRVFVGSTSVSAMGEDLANRLLTRNVYIHELVESRDAGTGKVTATLNPVVSYSDRPQYLAQASTGRIYFSTMPTDFAPEGTVRYIDPNPAYPAPDPRIIWQYAPFSAGTIFRYAIFNVDSVRVTTAGPNSTQSDGIFIYDHPYGQKTGLICVNAPGCPVATTDGTPVGSGGVPNASVAAAITTMIALGSDIEGVLRLDLTALPLKDTTFVAASFNNNWIAFGEGNSSPGETGARVVMVADSTVAGVAPARPQFLSPVVTVRDLTENASERVFGLALDRTGKNIGAHGLQSYLSEIDNPFHLRLQGKYDSNDNGAGVAFHPDADGRTTPMLARLLFVASSTGDIEVVDAAYFINRGKLALKYPIYGPLRATRPMPGDDPSIILKLFALTQRGLIVIDVTQADIKAGPP
ncbi:MAG TPA: Ig-like domain-containing protein [Gemmatimonadaceae bacterium]|nr:Ig-like domain-containing protein [Gemmatimonadaceae bacterium]